MNDFKEKASVYEKSLRKAEQAMYHTYSHSLGMEILEYQEGYCLTRLPIKQEYLNPLGGLHGGFMYTIADTAAGIAASHPGSEESVTTISGNMQFLRAALDIKQLYAKATVIKDGKRIAFVDAVLTSEDGTVYAKGSFSFARIVLPQKKEVV